MKKQGAKKSTRRASARVPQEENGSGFGADPYEGKDSSWEALDIACWHLTLAGWGHGEAKTLTPEDALDVMTHAQMSVAYSQMSIARSLAVLAQGEGGPLDELGAIRHQLHEVVRCLDSMIGLEKLNTEIKLNS